MYWLLIFVVWYFIGIAGFCYWWTSEFDLTSKELPTMFFIGLVGVFSWIFGYFIFRPDKVYFKSRRK
jgi:hypothetical protein